MPLFFVDDSVLDNRLQCVVCSIRGQTLFVYEDSYGKIYEKAGLNELEREYLLKGPLEMSVPFYTDGLKLCDSIIQIVGADMVYSKDFKADIYKSYDRIMRMLKDSDFISIVFTHIPYSSKRLGNMNSFKTGMILARHFIDLYGLIDRNIYVLIKKQTVKDVRDNYVSTYVSTSRPLSKRHKPLVYPLKTYEELKEYELSADVVRYYDYYAEKDFKLEIKNETLRDVCECIKETFKEDDKEFCIRANMSKQHYIQMVTSDYLPDKNEIIGISMALHLELFHTFRFLHRCNYDFDYDDPRDCEAISAIATHKYDVYDLNQKLYLKGLQQVGSYTSPYEF